MRTLAYLSLSLICVTGTLCAQVTSSDGDWAARQVTLIDTPEAGMMVRVGDIDNLGFGWPEDFDPFSGDSTPAHEFPWAPDPLEPASLDRILVVSSYSGGANADGYAESTSRPENRVAPIVLAYDLGGRTVNGAVLQMFIDDFQAPVFGAEYTVTINGVRAAFLESVINRIEQTGPIGKLITVQVPDALLDQVRTGRIEILIDDTTTGAGDGYAIDFVKLLINPVGFSRTGTVTGTVLSGDGPIRDALVSASGVVEVVTGADGAYTIEKVPAGLLTLTAAKPGYLTAARTVDLLAGEIVEVFFTLERAASVDLIATMGSSTGLVHGAGSFSITATLRNAGPEDVFSASMTVGVPEQVEVLSASAGGAPVTVTDGNYVTRFGTVEAGQTRTVTLDVRAIAAGQVTFTAEAAAEELWETAPADNFAAVDVLLNAIPEVAITSPAPNATFVACSDARIQASAEDPDGSIVAVEFFVNGTRLGEVVTLPFTFDWRQLPAGQYRLTVVARDDRGAVASSQEVPVTVAAARANSLIPHRLASGQFAVCFAGEFGKRYDLQASVDFVTWETVKQFLPTESSFEFVDLETKTFPKRYFQAVEVAP